MLLSHRGGMYNWERLEDALRHGGVLLLCWPQGVRRGCAGCECAA